MIADTNGQTLQVGDKVLVPCRVTALLPSHPLFTVEVQTILPDGDGYHPVIGLNAEQVRKEMRGRPRGKRQKAVVV